MTKKQFDIEVIILAAGLSRRMGEQNKLLMSLDGVPLVRRSVRQYRACSDNVTVVLGHDADKVRAALEGLDVTCIENPDYEAGRQSTARFGLQHAALDHDGLMIGLADQPLLGAIDLSQLMFDFYMDGRDRISIPYFGDKRGNPVIFPPAVARQMRDSNKAPGCRKFIEANPDLVNRVPVSNHHYTTDMDVPQDAAAYGYLTGNSLHYRVRSYT